MRAFVAVDLPTEPAAAARAPAHFTLLFLGELPEPQVEPLSRALREALGRVAPFRLEFSSEVGAFPSADRPRVVFLSVGVGAEPLRQLALEVRRVADTIGARYDPKPFVPHLTLYRVRGPADRARAASDVGRAWSPLPAPFEVNRAFLKESTLAPSGAVHRVVAELPLAGVVGQD